MSKLLWIMLLAGGCKNNEKASPPAAPVIGSAAAPISGDSAVPATPPVGSGVSTNERQVTAFDGVELVGSIDVEVTVGGAQRVQIEASPELVPLVTTEVKGQTLVVSTKPEFRGGNVVVRVAMPSLVLARLGGSGNVHLESVHAEDLSLEVSGSGNLDARGTARHLKITVTGSGELRAKALTAEAADVTSTGSGSVEVAATASLGAELTGSGSVRYFGNPPKVTKHVTGSGAIEAGG